MTKQQNTRPSASREIAVKPLKSMRDVYDLDEEGVLDFAETPFGDYEMRLNKYRQIGTTELVPGVVVKHKKYALFLNGSFLFSFDKEEEFLSVAQADYNRRILSAIDTTPGNTDPIDGHAPDEERQMQMAVEQDRPDPIAKDDELRKVQGGWRDMDDPELERITGNRGLVDIWVPNLGRITDVLHPSVYVGPTHWRLPPPAPTEHPTEQPSVRDVLSKAANDAIQGYAERTDMYASGFRNGIFTMRKAALRSLVQDGRK